MLSKKSNGLGFLFIGGSMFSSSSKTSKTWIQLLAQDTSMRNRETNTAGNRVGGLLVRLLCLELVAQSTCHVRISNAFSGHGVHSRNCISTCGRSSWNPSSCNILIVKSTGISFLNCIHRDVEKGSVSLSITFSYSSNSGDSIILGFSRGFFRWGSESTVKDSSSSSSFGTGLAFMLALAASCLFHRHGIKPKFSTELLIVTFSLPLTKARVVGRHCQSK